MSLVLLVDIVKLSAVKTALISSVLIADFVFKKLLGMAVFTDITDPIYIEQLLEIERAFNLTIWAIEEISAGSSDTKFKIIAKEYDEPLVLTIHETPDVTPAGLTSKKTREMLLYVDYLANTIHGHGGLPRIIWEPFGLFCPVS